MTALPNESIEQRLDRLEREVLRLSALCNGIRKPAERRLGGLAGVAAALLLSGAAVAGSFAAGSFVQSYRATLQQYMQYESSVAFPPLDSMVTWGRADEPSAPSGATTELLSLIAEGSQTNSFFWPLYIELRGTKSGAATMLSSQSAGATVRSVVRSTGSPWTTSFHSELAHGRSSWTKGIPVPTEGTSILYNGEMRSFTTGGETIGLNLQCVYSDATSRRCDHGINIQAGSAATYWQNGIHFDSHGDYTTGNIGINFDRSHYNMGLDLADNSLRLNAGQRITLDRSGTVYIRENPSNALVEFVRNGSVVASF
jgi:hypothetical protein